jgi:uncharacterized protein (TIGR02679 family)
MQPVVEQALRVVEALPGPEPVQRAVLAARLFGGDPHALDPGTPLHGLVVAMLVAVSGVDDDVGAREVWRRYGVVVDPVSSFVTALGLRLVGDGVAARMVRAASGGHVVLTYGQLAAGGFAWPRGMPCFSCENPSVLIAAERSLGRACAPLVCTGGFLSDAARLLLTAVTEAGEEIRHHGDFDEAGLAIFRDLEVRYGALPWRFHLDGLRSALRRLGGATDGSSLDEMVTGLRQPVPEELLLDELLGDLRAAGEGHLARPADYPSVTRGA